MTRTIEMVDAILDEKGAPVHLMPLYDEIVRRGLPIGGKKPPYTLSARLSNSGRYVSSRESGWWFADRPVPTEVPETKAQDEASDPEIISADDILLFSSAGSGDVSLRH